MKISISLFMQALSVDSDMQLPPVGTLELLSRSH
jgi:hypothetical protein